MSLKDVFSGQQSFWSWLTGRDSKEADIYANYDKVEEVVSKLRNISKNEVATAQENIYAAFEQLNKVKGLAEYVGTIEVNNYDSFFGSIGDVVDDITEKIESKAESIKAYEEQPFLTKFGSTLTMGICKIGEGLLSVFEDLGDGIVSVVGWVAPKDSGLENACAEFIKKEWSHDVFNGYYNSNFAKASFFTEDSAAANCFKVVGKVTGFVAAGYVTAGALGLGATATYGTGLLSASGTTIGGTVVAGVSGLGSGTEAGLNEGMEYNDAFKLGVKQGAKSAAVAFVAGKATEGLVKYKNAKAGGGDVAGGAEGASEGLAERAAEGAADGVAEGTAESAETEAVKQSLGKRIGEKLGTTKDKLVDGIKGGASKIKGVPSKALDALKAYPGKAATALAENGAAITEGGIKAALTAGGVGAAVGAALYDQKFQSDHEIGDFRVTIDTTPQALYAPPPTTAPVSDAVTDPPTAPEDIVPTSPPTKPEDIVPTSPPTKPEDIIPTDPPTDPPPTNAPTDPPTDPPTDAPTDPPTDPPTDAPTNPPTEAPTEPPTDPEDIIPTDPPTDPEDIIPTDPPTDPDREIDSIIDTTPVTDPEDIIPTDPEEIIEDTTPDTIPEEIIPTDPPTDPEDIIPTVPDTEPVVTPTDPTGSTSNGGGEVSYVSSAIPVSGGGTGYTSLIDEGSSNHSGAETDGDTIISDPFELEKANDLDALEEIEEKFDEDSTSIQDVIENDNTIKQIPKIDNPITPTKKTSNSVIPIAAGLSVAAAAGIGAKAYMDYKKNNATGEEEDEYEDEYEDDFSTEEWQGDEGTVKVDYNQSSPEEELEEDNYYQEEEDSGYKARNASEFSELQ